VTAEYETWYAVGRSWRVYVKPVKVYRHTDKSVWIKWKDVEDVVPRRHGRDTDYYLYCPTQAEAYAKAVRILEHREASAKEALHKVQSYLDKMTTEARKHGFAF